MTSPATSTRKEPMRTCIGCRQVMPQRALVRLAIVDAPPFVVPDPKKRLGGRGAWIEPRRQCVERAAKKGGFQRALRRGVQVDTEQTIALMRAGLERRLWSLLGGGYRAQKVCFGTETVRESIAARRIAVLGVAEDAAGRRDELTRQWERIAIYGTKEQLGEVFGRSDVGVYSIEDEGIGAEVLRVTSHLAGLRVADAFTYDDGGAASCVAGDQEHA